MAPWPPSDAAPGALAQRPVHAGTCVGALLRRLRQSGPAPSSSVFLVIWLTEEGYSPRRRAGRSSAYGLGALGASLLGGYLAVAQSYVADLAPLHLRGRCQGAWGLTFMLALVLAPVFGTAAHAASPTALWLSCGALGVVSALLVLGVIPRARRRDKTTRPAQPRGGGDTCPSLAAPSRRRRARRFRGARFR
jgi:hypothetical protein